MALDWTAIENAIHAMFVASSGLPAGRVFWLNQRMPEPVRPYATLRLDGPVRIGGLDEVQEATNLANPTGQEVEITAVGRRSLTLSCQAYSEAVTGAGTAREIVGNVQTKLALPTALATLRAAGLSVVDPGNAQDLTQLLETKFESRAVLDVQLYATDLAVERTGYIATADVVDGTTP